MLSHAFHILRGELSLLTVWKNALCMFIHNKNMISKKHEFAIVILRDSAEWVSTCRNVVPNPTGSVFADSTVLIGTLHVPFSGDMQWQFTV